MIEPALPHNYIAIEGPIGVGKTSLARRLADDFGGNLILESAEDNPFLERFYGAPKESALPVQLSFLMQRVRLSEELKQDDLFHTLQIADFIVQKDRIFAQLTLDDDELALYNMVYDNLTMEHRAPDLVIYLYAPQAALKSRILQRGVGYEQNIKADYLTKLNDAYANFFHYYEAGPLLMVNAQEIDLVNDDGDYLRLVSQIRAARAGRHFYNPSNIG